MRSILSVLVSTLLVAGCAGATGSAAPPASAPAPAAASAEPAASASASAASPAAPASASGVFGGTVKFESDGAPATTVVDGVADGSKVSGTAVTTFARGTHTVKLGCAAKSGGSFVLGGTVEKTTVPGETAGPWSAVIVKEGTPPQIGIWLSGDLGDASDCASWVASINPAELPADAFSPVESGTLVPPG